MFIMQVQDRPFVHFVKSRVRYKDLSPNNIYIIIQYNNIYIIISI